jgi:NAD(P)-dependent dehydrogenase (short-subunit alcohol dehydrogenase family)
VASHDSVDNPEGGQAIVDAAVDAFGRVDAVVSNAGIFNSIPFGKGWMADVAGDPTADDVLAHLDEVSATDPYLVPDTIVDQVLEVCGRLGISAMPDNAEVAFPEPTKQ